VYSTMARGATSDVAEQHELVLLHLSDIHFTVETESGEYSVDEAVRRRMLDDIRSQHDRIGDVDVILLVGDVAFKGKDDEYQRANAWLDEVAAAVGCNRRENVLCVPGNHDVDRGAHTAPHGAFRTALRTIDPAKLSDALLRLLRDPMSSRQLLDPLEQYNNFALPYGCEVRPDQIVWAPRELALGPRTVRIHGVTSAWICDATDAHEEDAKRVVAGVFQLTETEPDDRISIVMCHHPLRWLRDSIPLRPWLEVAHLRLFGHEHAAGIDEDGDHRGLSIASGAVTPPVGEPGWKPAYNFIRLRLDGQDPDVCGVEIFARCWQERAEFGPDPRQPYPYSTFVNLRPSREPAPVSESEEAPLAVPQPEPVASDNRAIMLAVMRAAPDSRHRAARELGLLDGLEHLTGVELERELLKHAVDSGQLEELGRRVVDDEHDN